MEIRGIMSYRGYCLPEKRTNRSCASSSREFALRDPAQEGKFEVAAVFHSASRERHSRLDSQTLSVARDHGQIGGDKGDDSVSEPATGSRR